MKDYTDLLNADIDSMVSEPIPKDTDSSQDQPYIPDIHTFGEDYSYDDIPKEAQQFIDMSDEELYQAAAEDPDENMNLLTEESLCKFLSKVSAASGSTLSYQSYNYDAPQDDPDRFDVFTASDVDFSITKNMAYEDLLQADLTFRSPQDPELKRLWTALKRHTKNMQKYPNNRWVFFMKVDNSSNIYVQMANPVMFFLTRSEPEVLAQDEKFEGSLQGGNMVRFLFSRETVIFGEVGEIEEDVSEV